MYIWLECIPDEIIPAYLIQFKIILHNKLEVIFSVFIKINLFFLIDIDEIKKDIFDLEGKFKSFKIHLQIKLVALKKHANEIENEVSL